MTTRPPRSRPMGFTLIELLVTISIMAVLLGVAAPYMMDAALSGRLSSSANNLLASMTLARSEALKRNANVVICISTNGTSCTTSGNWEQGWLVFADADKDGATGGTNDVVLQYQEAQPTGLSMKETIGSAKAITFPPVGTLANSYSFTVCRSSPSVGKEERVVYLSPIGRATVKKTTNGVCS